MKFNVGDRVKVTSVGQCYSTYSNFFIANNIDYDIATRYAFGVSLSEVPNVLDTTFVIVAHGLHEITEDNLYVIRSEANNICYLINESGINCPRRKMTIEQIERSLGYKIDIVE